jgi:DNA-binding winged helix-turn-helix (wHTH) protein
MNSDISSLKRWRPWEPDVPVSKRQRHDRGQAADAAEPLTALPDIPRARHAGSAPPFSGLSSTESDLRIEHIVRVGEAHAAEAIPPGWEVHRGQPGHSSDAVVRVSGLCIDRLRGTVVREDGCPTGLKDSRVAFVVALAARPGGFVTRGELMGQLPMPFQNRLGTDWQALRDKFAPGVFRYVPGKGYGLVAGVRGRTVEPPLRVGRSWTLCPTHQVLKHADGTPIHLRFKESALLCLLLRHAGDIVSYRQAAAALCIPESTPTPPPQSIVGPVCSNLRKDLAAVPLSIETVSKKGYRLTVHEPSG